jgi:putative tryptophan/tyrosine transport system substrate-binding protein
MRKFILLLLMLFIAAFALPALAQDEELPEDAPVIGIMQFVSHPALDAGREGAVQVLNEAGFVDGETARFLFGNGEGDIPTLTTIAQSFVDEGADIIIAVSTPAAQAAYAVVGELEGEGPAVIFNVVTSPYGAGIAQASCIKEPWITGSQALAPYAETVPLIFDIVPDADTVGYIYNSAEANSVANTEIITPIMEELGLTMEIQSISASAEVPAAAEALIEQGVDVFYVATDSTVVAGLEGLIQVANDNGVPVIASDPSSAVRGAVIAQGLDYMQEGRDAGRMAVAYLNDDLDIATTGISVQKTNLLAVNLDAAEAQGVEVPQELLDRAGIVIEGGAETRPEPITMSDQEQADADAAFFEGLLCTEEKIAEQQAELDAAAEAETES